jgi:hypothetical protein
MCIFLPSRVPLCLVFCVPNSSTGVLPKITTISYMVSQQHTRQKLPISGPVGLFGMACALTMHVAVLIRETPFMITHPTGVHFLLNVRT